ncbi:arylsulfotransferase (ASST) domain-containing protein [Purpureocillium lavendulum]|uniref:Arylsulfotransferase (ASST) domain-containing protein n=1 Tax=Purpureocillium lavendulum TaxID=1247861 RepID=A0AB34FLH5_9HYPO|nr:arylsulfotransferase (ASST) domain-containing protein [Purpureocillium lavendulum]
MTDDGHLIWATPPASYATRNLKPWKLRGKDVLLYNNLHYLNKTAAVAYGTVVILDDTYTILYNVTLQDPDLNPIFPGHHTSLMDSHEALITADNTLLVVTTNATRWDLSPVGGPSDGWLRDSILYELDIDTNEVIYRWRASDDIPITWSKAPLGSRYGDGTSKALAWDAFHVNSLDDFEDGYMVSARNCWLGAFVRKSAGRMVWRIEGSGGGSFKLDPRAAFSWQHDMRLKTDSVTGGVVMHMINNRNSKPGSSETGTNGLVMDLNLATRTATLRQIFEDAAHPAYAWHAGSLAWSPGAHAFLSYGSEARMQEFDDTGTPVYELSYGIPDVGHSTRGYRHMWRGFPTRGPDAVACRRSGGGDVHVFMSWNGATEYTHWSVYDASSEDFVAFPMARVQRTGFETHAVVATRTDLILVEASGGQDPRSTTRRSDAIVVLADCQASGVDVESGV